MARLIEIPAAQWTDPPGYGKRESRRLYLIQEDLGPVKVGVATHVIWRLSSMRCGNPRVLFLRHVWDVAERADAFRREKEVLREFTKFRMVGEWLNVPLGVVADFIRSAK